MKKRNINLDYKSIRKRIENEKQNFKPKEWAEKVGVSLNIVSNIHGKTAQNPSLEYIISVAKATGKTVDYFLYGDEEKLKPSDTPSQVKIPDPDFTGGLEPKDTSGEYLQVLMKTAEILKTDGDYKNALVSNVRAFHRAIDAENQIIDLKKKCTEFEDRLEHLEKLVLQLAPEIEEKKASYTGK